MPAELQSQGVQRAIAELTSEKEQLHQRVVALEEEVLVLKQNFDAQQRASLELSGTVAELSKELETSRQRVAALEEEECSQRLQVFVTCTIVCYSKYGTSCHIIHCQIVSHRNSSRQKRASIPCPLSF